MWLVIAVVSECKLTSSEPVRNRVTSRLLYPVVTELLTKLNGEAMSPFITEVYVSLLTFIRPVSSSRRKDVL